MTHRERVEFLTEALTKAGVSNPEPRALRLALEVSEDERWATQPYPCSGVGYAHAPHGACPGYGSDRT